MKTETIEQKLMEKLLTAIEEYSFLEAGIPVIMIIYYV